MKRVVLSVVSLLFATSAFAEIITKEVLYSQDSVTFKGYMAYDNKIKGKKPGILVAHEWWGLNDFSKTKAKELASLGYCAFAADLYGNGKTASDAKTAAQLAGEVRGTSRMRERIVAGYNEMLKQEMVDSNRTARLQRRRGQRDRVVSRRPYCSKARRHGKNKGENSNFAWRRRPERAPRHD